MYAITALLVLAILKPIAQMRLEAQMADIQLVRVCCPALSLQHSLQNMGLVLSAARAMGAASSTIVLTSPMKAA